MQPQAYDVVVVGGGHAGCEAALAAHRLGARVLLLTLRPEAMGQLSCNPAIGGVGKGHLVRELDALGGAMGQVADASGIQFRRLNVSRGAAVQSTRAQVDAKQYRQGMGARLQACAGLSIMADEAIDLELTAGRLTGVRTRKHGLLACRSAILTTGTFLGGVCHVGTTQVAGGRAGDVAAQALPDALRRLGLVLRRFKTGTTPRLAADSIAWAQLQRQDGDLPAPKFAFDPVPGGLAQIPCHITHTTPATHAILRENLHLSPLYGGIIRGLGPRYCPSLEDKVVRFAARERHQVFLEPEGLDTDWIYPNGLSTSLPEAVQLAFLRTIPGLESVKILRAGYAVAYDYAPPTQLHPNLMTKQVPGLFLAGQINGTSGYEEAAVQGLMAGLNAVRHLGAEASVVLRRDQAYIGVLIDDLVTQGVDEPYRIFTSRAEHRLVLRESNAEARLAPLAAELGLIDAGRSARAQAREAELAALRSWLRGQRVDAPLAAALGADGSGSAGMSYERLLRRPPVRLGQLPVPAQFSLAAQAGAEEAIKYAGFIAREDRAIQHQRELEGVQLPANAVYRDLPGLSNELQEKLTAVAPRTLGQASRIVGMTPAGLSLLRTQVR